MSATTGSPQAGALGYRFGVQPSGPNGSYTRKDRFRAAGASVLGALGCFALALLGVYVASNSRLNTLPSRVALVATLIGELLGVVALLAALIHLVRGLLTRASQATPVTERRAAVMPAGVPRPIEAPISSPPMTAPALATATPSLQFDRAVAADGPAPGSGVVCAKCGRTVVSSYFTIAQKPFCGSCKTRMEQSVRETKSTAAFLRAIAYGSGAALAGAAIYYAVIAFLNLEIGLVAILIGFMVGASIRKAARGGGGKRYQLLGAALTYFAVGLAYTPIAVKAALKDRAATADSARATAVAPATQAAGDTAALATAAAANTPAPAAQSVGAGSIIVGFGLALFFIAALPVMIVFGSGAGGMLSALIIGFGMRQAWRMAAAPSLAFIGPLRVAPPADAAVAPA